MHLPKPNDIYRHAYSDKLYKIVCLTNELLADQATCVVFTSMASDSPRSLTVDEFFMVYVLHQEHNKDDKKDYTALFWAH